MPTPTVVARPAWKLQKGTWLAGVGCAATTTAACFWPDDPATSLAMKAWAALKQHAEACGKCDTESIGATLLDDRRN